MFKVTESHITDIISKEDITYDVMQDKVHCTMLLRNGAIVDMSAETKAGAIAAARRKVRELEEYAQRDYAYQNKQQFSALMKGVNGTAGVDLASVAC